MDLTFEQAEIEFWPVLKWEAARLTKAGVEFADAYQEARIALFRAMSTYNPNKGARFATYVRTVLDNAAKNLVKYANREARRQKIIAGDKVLNVDPLYLEDRSSQHYGWEELVAAGLEHDPEEALSRAQLRRVFEHFAAELMDRLDDAGREILRLNLDPPAELLHPGESIPRQTEIVAHLGISPGRYFSLYRKVRDAAVELVSTRPQFEELRGFSS